jgi:hypothetical protein
MIRGHELSSEPEYSVEKRSYAPREHCGQISDERVDWTAADRAGFMIIVTHRNTGCGLVGAD